jgi:hypothetical protein
MNKMGFDPDMTGLDFIRPTRLACDNLRGLVS